MKFSELPENTKIIAAQALKDLLTATCVPMDTGQAKIAGGYVAAAFIAMEHHDSAPDVCEDGV